MNPMYRPEQKSKSWRELLFPGFHWNGFHLGSPAVLDTGNFKRALHREWSRSQRTNLPLALIVIGQAESAQGAFLYAKSVNRAMTRIAGVVAERIRCTDVLGWHDAAKLGILLPHTSGKEAWALAEEIQEKAERLLEDPVLSEQTEVKVYAYPEDGAEMDYANSEI